MLAIAKPEDAVSVLRLAQARLGETISAFELLSAQGMALLAARLPDVRRPFAEPYPWFALIEVGGARVRAPFEAALAEAFDRGLARDAIIAESATQAAQLWRVREETPTANKLTGAIASHDVSTPVSRIGRFVADADAALRAQFPEIRINAFGHVGDGNLHYNVFPPEGAALDQWREHAAAVSRIVHDVVASHHGSITAEHGVGRFKARELTRYGDPAKLSAMRAIKAALDPHGIMNPGAVIPRD